MNSTRAAQRSWVHLIAIISALSGLICIAGGCNPSACEERRTWRNATTAACQSCVASSCSHEQMAVANAQNGCAAEFACVARCPDQSDLTCGCVSQCLVTTRCQQTTGDLTACEADHCSGACH